MGLHGKLVLITGSARGFGKGFAEAVLAAGAKVGGMRKKKEYFSTVQNNLHPLFKVTICDVLEEEGKKTAKALEEKYGKEKVTICNAIYFKLLDWISLQFTWFAQTQVFWTRLDVTSDDEWRSAWDDTVKHFNVGFISSAISSSICFSKKKTIFSQSGISS